MGTITTKNMIMISSTDKKIKKYEISGQEDSVTEIYQP